MKGPDLSQYFLDKDNNQWLAAKMKKKYAVDHEKWAYVIDTINDRTIWIIAMILYIKVVRNNLPNQCTSRVIACTEHCAKGVQMNWSLILLNQLLEDRIIVQDGEKPFTYSWLLILIELVGCSKS